MIRLERVTKIFGTVTAVDGVDLDVPSGAVCVRRLTSPGLRD